MLTSQGGVVIGVVVDHVEHETHLPSVQGLRQPLECRFIAKSRLDPGEVSDPVAVKGTPLSDGLGPHLEDGGEPHGLDAEGL